MDTTTFAQKIKQKYPQYQAVDDVTLVTKFLEKYPVYKSQVQLQTETGIDIQETGQSIKEAAFSGADKIQELKQKRLAGEQGRLRTTLQQLGIGAGTASDVLGEAVIGAGKVLLPQKAETAIKTGVEKGVTGVVDLTNRYDEIKKTNPTLAFGINTALGFAPDAALKAKDLIGGYEKLKQTNPKVAQDIDSALGFVKLGLDLTGVGFGAKGAKIAGQAGMEAVETIAKEGVELVGKAKGTVGEIVQKTPNALAKFVSPDIDPKFKTALQRTTKQEVDEMENIVKGAVENADNPSAFEIVGNKLADATEQVNKQVKSLSKQKKDIISQAKYGFEEFKNETGKTILEINKQLKDSSLAKSFIARLKKVNTKLDADNAIDDLQEILYKGNKDMTIPLGSNEDRVLRGIIGKYNSQLKESLPSAYRKLNEQISQKLDNLELLNKSLGEVVDGVPIRGASLIKQYFSPSGTKAKELFEFIKKNTGYDVGKDSVLAKYMSEIYGETRAASLLDNVPRTASGTIDKLLDFALEKTGVSGKVSELARKGKVLKAKDVAQ